MTLAKGMRGLHVPEECWRSPGADHDLRNEH